MKTKQVLCALLAALTLCGCAQKPAPSAGGSAPASSALAEEKRAPVTTEAEVRALYGADASSIVSVTPYEEDFLVQLDYYTPRLDWVYGKSGVRRELMMMTEGAESVEILGTGYIQVLTDGVNVHNGQRYFPHYETASIIDRYDEYGDPLPYGEGYASIDGTEVYWAPITETHSLGMEGRREALSGAQLEVSGLSLSFGPLADGSDFASAYCWVPDTEISYDERNRTLTVTCHDTYLDSGELNKESGVDEAYLRENGSIYPADFPEGPLAGRCRLVESSYVIQSGDDAVILLVLAECVEQVQYTVETGYEGPADTAPYLRLKLRKAASWQ
ncbi:MAG: hypothetical protein J6J81_01165 [Oscillospiraceae bacterium]|nr:hypothetical protein [Oscillospiraceae bacterium]